MDELSVIDRYFRPLAGEGSFRLLDDAARLAVPADADLVVTADMLAERVHFLPDDPPATIAQKALRVNISDLAAKGAAPLAYVLSVGLGPDVDEAWLAGFSEGLRLDQARYGIHLLGGDTIAVRHGPVISVVAFGLAPKGRMVHRFGGEPGDLLYVSGTIGAATAGLAFRQGRPGSWDTLEPAAREKLVALHRVPEPRIELAPVLAAFASAAMDVSDGLIGDCDKLAGASGCSAIITAERVPLPRGLEHVRDDERAALLAGGEDFEILAAVRSRNGTSFEQAAAAAGVPVTQIGALTQGSSRTTLTLHGRKWAVDKRSYVHGREGG